MKTEWGEAGRDRESSRRREFTTQEEVSWLFGGFQVIRPEGGRVAGIMEVTGLIKYTSSGIDEKAGKQGKWGGRERSYLFMRWCVLGVLWGFCGTCSSTFDHSSALMWLKMEITLYQPVRSEEAEDSAWIANLLGHLENEKNTTDFNCLSESLVGLREHWKCPALKWYYVLTTRLYSGVK